MSVDEGVYADVRERATARVRRRGLGMLTLRELVEPVMGPFLTEVQLIAEIQRLEGREIGEGDAFVWTFADWDRFCDAARRAMLPAEDDRRVWFEWLGLAVIKRVRRVEELRAAGMTEREIHTTLWWDLQSLEVLERRTRARLQRERDDDVARARKKLVDEATEAALIRLEGAERAKALIAERRGRPPTGSKRAPLIPAGDDR